MSRGAKNNGVAARVKLLNNMKLNKSNTISVAVSGSVLEAFLQKEPYYTGYHIFILEPKLELSDIEMLFYCMCIRANKYKYNYGRQANRTLKI
ncbi:restriction endonuclease subunit S [Brachyspira hyodysenteriae]|nr:restriction endonuclease subunit S [Brachyspira hyodysenteriae]MCZ9990026.1 restriction endonuclease subunit S [Brachyspira hyodysenteriae]